MSSKCRRVKRVRPRRGFTLLELVIVIAIIAVLASVVAPNLVRHAGDAKVQAARSQIEMLGLALEAYHLDLDDYPRSADGLEALRVRPAEVSDTEIWRGPYIKRDVPTDPWGRPYVYRYPGLVDSTTFEILTLGRDGIPGGTGDDRDMNSWENAPRGRND